MWNMSYILVIIQWKIERHNYYVKFMAIEIVYIRYRGIWGTVEIETITVFQSHYRSQLLKISFLDSKSVFTLTLMNLFSFHFWNCPLSILVILSRWQLEVSQQYRAWSDCVDVQASLALYWWQRLIAFSSSRTIVCFFLTITTFTTHIHHLSTKFASHTFFALTNVRSVT